MNTINIKKELRLKFESDALFDIFNFKKVIFISHS